MSPRVDALPPGATAVEDAVHDPSGVPVVLVHGTNRRRATDWHTLAPLVADSGLQVFAFGWHRTRPGPERSATRAHVEDLTAYLDDVAEATGATQVDLVGHSWGAVLARHVARGGATGRAWSVRSVVGLAPTYAGTTFNGLARHLDHPWAAQVRRVLDDKLPSWREQLPSSEVLRQLDAAGGDDGVAYTTIITRCDRVVTPWDASIAAEPRAACLVVQHHDRGSRAGHLGILHHPGALDRVVRALTTQHINPATAGIRR